MISNRSGFVLVETLIASVFMMTLLSLLYANLSPVIAEYERRSYYDTVSNKYVAHWARKMILDKGQPEIFTLLNGYLDVTDCVYYKDANFCETFKKVNYIQKIYLTDYDVKTFKNYIQDDTRFTRALKDYLEVLPDYAAEPGVYRVIVEIRNGSVNEISSFANIEVRR